MQSMIILACVVLLSAITPPRIRWMLLLGGSIVFYFVLDLPHFAFLAGTCVVDYAIGRGLGSSSSSQTLRRWLLGTSLLWNLGVLIFFKYSTFFLQSIDALSGLSLSPTSPFKTLLIPLGLSFYTFRSLSYVFDVYRNNRTPERHFGYYALYVTFFPTLLAGPIDRSAPTIAQFKHPSLLTTQHLVSGLRLLLFGSFLKYVIADNLSVYVNGVYDNIHAFAGPALVLATYFFSMQIFSDFAGYSLIALGSARLLGIDVIQNFRRPYLATSVSEFWNRWHISLSQWLRDYVYFPLGGSRGSLPRTIRNILITFLVSGLWHGANWTYIVWGAIHGLCISVERCFRAIRGNARAVPSRLLKAFQIVVTFHVVTAAWVFFRARSIGDGLYVFRHLATGWSDLHILPGTRVTGPILILCGTLYILLLGTMIVQEYRRPDMVDRWPRALRWSLYYATIFGLLFLQANQVQDFIYLQF